MFYTNSLAYWKILFVPDLMDSTLDFFLFLSLLLLLLFLFRHSKPKHSIPLVQELFISSSSSSSFSFCRKFRFCMLNGFMVFVISFPHALMKNDRKWNEIEDTHRKNNGGSTAWKAFHTRQFIGNFWFYCPFLPTPQSLQYLEQVQININNAKNKIIYE